MSDEPSIKLQLHPRTIDTSTDGGNPSSSAGPIPMSMPSILRNPGTSSSSNHLSYLLDRRSAPSSSYPPAVSRNTRSRTSTKEPSLGRRKQRRSDNARLLANPHAVRPTIKDYRLHSNEIRSTFPLSTCGGKVQAIPVPSASGVGYSEPTHDADKANHGHFGKSLKDAQRVLKRLEVGNINDDMIAQQRAGELERFIWLVDRELRGWSQGEVFVYSTERDRKLGTVLLDDSFEFTRPPLKPASAEAPTIHLDTLTPSTIGGQLVEFQRTPNALVWLINDPFLRLIVHCLARVCKCPSFSKDDVSRPRLRFTWILNKNSLARRQNRRGRRVSVTSSTDLPPMPRPIVAGLMETPPTTDFDSQTESEVDTDTDADGASSMSDSLVLVKEEAEEEEVMGGEQVDTDEEEAEILRRVRRWAIDSHRLRDESSSDKDSGKPKPRRRTASSTQQDPDATLTNTTITEEQSSSDDDDFASHSDT